MYNGGKYLGMWRKDSSDSSDASDSDERIDTPSYVEKMVDGIRRFESLGAARSLRDVADLHPDLIASWPYAMDTLLNYALPYRDHESMRSCAASILMRVSYIYDIVGLISGALERLVDSLDDYNDSVRTSTAWALSNSAYHSVANREKIGSIPRVFERLVTLLWNRDSWARASAAAALTNLSLHADNRVKIISTPEALKSLVALLHDKTPGFENYVAKQYAAAALCTLAADDADNKMKIASLPGALEALVELLLGDHFGIDESSLVSVRQTAAAALKNLSTQAPISAQIERIKAGASVVIATKIEQIKTTETRNLSYYEPIRYWVPLSESLPKTLLAAFSISSDPVVSSGSTAGASTMSTASTGAGSSSSSLSRTRYEDIERGTILGEGGFGVVYRGKWSHIDVAVKQLKVARLSEKALTEFRTEAELHGALRHANVVQLYAVCLEAAKYCMVMELMSNGSLFNVLHNGRELPWSLRLSIAKDIAVGLNYLHSRGILHRDLKSLNVLLDDRMRAKLSDFGLSTLKSESSSTTTAAKGKSAVGTVQWMAPELFKRGTKKSELSDIYALGMTLWELASREIPFKDGDGNEAVIIKWITDGEQEKIPEDTPKPFAALIARCWAQRAEDRPLTPAIIAELGAGLSGGASSTFSESSGYKVFSS